MLYSYSPTVQGRDNSDYVIRRNHHARQQRIAAGLISISIPAHHPKGSDRFDKNKDGGYRRS